MVGVHLGNPRRLQEADRGDTLVEVLVTVVILGVAVVGLLGALLTSAAASSTHRNLATVDSILRNFADNARYAIQTRPYTGIAGETPQFQPCATSASSYYLISAPYPSSGSDGTTFTVFSIGTTSTDVVKLGTKTLTSSFNAATNVWTLTIPNPSGLAVSSTPYALTFTHSGTTYTAPSGFTLTNGSATNSSRQYASYSVNATLNRFNPNTNAFDSATTCSSTSNPQLQQLALTVANSETNSGAAETQNILLANLSPLALPSVSVTSPTAALGSSVTLTSTVSGISGTPSASDGMTWSPPSGFSCVGGNTKTLSASWQSTCQVNSLPAGTYNIGSTYTPDPSRSAAVGNGFGTATINQNGAATIRTALTAPASSPAALGSPITFTATVSGVPGFTPTGTVTWSNLPPGFTCDGGSDTTNVSGGQATCSLSSGLKATTYNPTATYSGDSNYSNMPTDHTATVTENKGTPSPVFPTPPGVVSGSTLTFTVSVNFPSAAAAPAGTVTWTITATGLPVHPACTKAGPTTSSGTSVYTCAVSGPSNLQFYSAAFSIAGDSNYNAAGPVSSALVQG